MAPAINAVSHQNLCDRSLDKHFDGIWLPQVIEPTPPEPPAMKPPMVAVCAVDG
jgi:hypothetical protein